ncbi:serine/threonine protein kinase [Pectobacterium polaris]|uniref:serine/threonine-protein kinase n=1 Tax=Pectobacterium polaris TaxID=2042057 RepID=UPI001CF1CA17|nr:serine/threonine-protein kinase [Pectobacterium polaris]MCA6941343.1 serine/threonine protein kinase [Pectobacterium polaris]MCA6956397.1 serine/threonine protein kinase [Pectobacterium polaris]
MEEAHGNYVVKPIKKIGRGGFGYVEKIELLNSDGAVCGIYARKVFSPQDPSYRDEFIRRFEREVLYQADCSHTNIVPIYIHHLTGDAPWFVMDLAESDLTTELTSGKLTVKEKINAIRMVLQGVAYLHDHNYWHRDLKPQNVLKFNNGTFKISDFGLVKNADKKAESEVITKVASIMGTERYMAPEVFAGIYSEKTDIFALGVLVEDMDLSAVPGIDDLITKSTARKPPKRHASVHEMLADLDYIVKGNGL